MREADRTTERPEQAVNATGGRFEVLNFGDAGADYRRNARSLRTALDAVHPDFVLLQWYFNDVVDPDHRHPPPLRLAGPWHYPLNARSALYAVANDGWSQLQFRFGFIPGTWTYFDRFRDPASAGSPGRI